LGAAGDGPWASRIAGRYALGTAIGAGGSGEVWAAHDAITGDEVAIKLMPALTGVELDRVRREVTALRRAQIPGVVRLRDDGLDGGVYFVVTDRILGRPFPGAPGPIGWDALAPIACRLLRVLDQVHRLGVVHRDLKPANVLVSDAGEPFVLDFGIAGGRALGTERDGAVRATPRYAAPERLRGEPGDVRTDLYGFGAMVFEAVTGWLTHRVASFSSEAIVRARLAGPATRLTGSAAVPPLVASIVDQLLASDPRDRPSTAAEVLRALKPEVPDPLAALDLLDRLPSDAPVDEDTLRDLFVGPDAFLHLRDDGAKALHRRTDGRPDAIRDELGSWIGQGLASVVDGRVVIERRVLDTLLLADPSDAPPIPVDAGDPGLTTVDELLDCGKIGLAAGAIALGLAVARTSGDREAEVELLVRAAAAALTAQTPEAID
ncbi:MAG: serine/threonine-protein kinase, partial [Myxococcota bacterium]